MRQEIRFCTTPDNVRLAYATTGTGPPLVRAAHWLTHLEHDVASPVWRHWIQDLSRDRTLVRYDLRGCGLSDRDVAEMSLDAYVRDLETIVDAVGLGEFALLGPSQGAAVAIAYAARHPERVSHLILYGGYARGRLRRPGGSQDRAEAEVLLDAVRVGWGRENPAFRQLFTTLFLPDGSSDELRSLNELQRISVSPATAARVRESFYQVDVTDLARRVQAPTLVIHAEHDAIVPLDEARHLATSIEGARLVLLQGRNHLLREGEPEWTEFRDVVHQFLSTPPSAGRALPTRTDPVSLTARERQVLELVAQARSNPEIASELGIRPKTLEKHISSVFRKLDVTTRAQAIVQGRAAGFGVGWGR